MLLPELKQLIVNYINNKNCNLILNIVNSYNNYIQDQNFYTRADISLKSYNTLNNRSKYFTFKAIKSKEVRGSTVLTATFYQLCFIQPRL